MANKEKLFSEFQAPTRQEWIDKIIVDLKGADFEKKMVWRTNEGNGFVNSVSSFNDACTVCSSGVEGRVQLENGDIIEKEYLHYNEEDFDDAYSDNEKLEPYEITFKFVFKVDDKSVYERIWDGTVYPKQVRNSVDLSNSDAPKDISSFSLFSLETVIRYLKYGRIDLLYHIIKKICETMSGGFNNPDAYTKSINYGKDENGIWHKFAEEKQDGKKITRGKLKRWYYFPPLFYMSEYYPWLERFPFLLPVAWGIRAFRGIFLKKGTKKREMLEVIEGEKAKTYQNIYRNMKLKFKH